MSIQTPFLRCKMLVGLCPIPFYSASFRCRLRVCSKHFYNKKDSLGLSHEGRILGYRRLSGFRFFSAVLFFCKEQFYVSPRTKKFLHFFFRFAVVRVECFLFCQQFGIFRVQLLDLGKRFQIGFIKCCFRCLVQRDLCVMRLQKSLAISCLSVGIINRSRFGVVDDVRFQHCNFCQPIFRGFNGITQFMITGSGSVHTLLHFFDADNFIFLQKIRVLDISFKL